MKEDLIRVRIACSVIGLIIGIIVTYSVMNKARIPDISTLTEVRFRGDGDEIIKFFSIHTNWFTINFDRLGVRKKVKSIEFMCRNYALGKEVKGRRLKD